MKILRRKSEVNYMYPMRAAIICSIFNIMLIIFRNVIYAYYILEELVVHIYLVQLNAHVSLYVLLHI